MRFAILSTIASVALATTYSDVIADTKTIGNSIVALNNTLNSYKAGDLVGAFGLLTSSGTLQDSLKKASSDVSASDPFGDNSQAVAVALVNLVNPTYSLLDNFVARKPDLDKPLFGILAPSTIVKSQLATAQTNVDAFGANVTQKLNAQFMSLAPQVIAQLDQHFMDAIAAFS